MAKILVCYKSLSRSRLGGEFSAPGLILFGQGTTRQGGELAAPSTYEIGPKSGMERVRSAAAILTAGSTRAQRQAETRETRMELVTFLLDG